MRFVFNTDSGDINSNFMRVINNILNGFELNWVSVDLKDEVTSNLNFVKSEIFKFFTTDISTCKSIDREIDVIVTKLVSEALNTVDIIWDDIFRNFK